MHKAQPQIFQFWIFSKMNTLNGDHVPINESRNSMWFMTLIIMINQNINPIKVNIINIIHTLYTNTNENFDNKKQKNIKP